MHKKLLRATFFRGAATQVLSEVPKVRLTLQLILRARVLATAELSGLKSDISLVEQLSSSQFIRGRAPALQCEDETVIFGVNVVCQYLHSKSKSGLLSSLKDQADVEHAIKIPLSTWDLQNLVRDAFKGVYKNAPSEVLPIIIKYGPGQDGRTAQKLMTQVIRDALTRAFPAVYNEETTPVEVKYDGRKVGNSVIDYCFSGSQQIMHSFKNNPEFDLKSPLEVAQRIISFINVEDYQWLIGKIDVVGIYINISLSPSFINSRVDKCSTSIPGKDRLPAAPQLRSSRVVIDFSSPNIAKEMHVGHLRSTVIGDSLCRLFEYFGDEVLRVNHVGDWGTQFGMLLEFLKEREEQTKEDTIKYLSGLTLAELTNIYKQSKKAFDASEEFKTRARAMVVALQSGKDPKARKVWETLVDVSRQGFERNYKLLNVSFDNPRNLPGVGYCGESFYQDQIEDAIKSLGKLVVKRGEAQLLFTHLPEAKQKPSEDHPDGEIPLFLRKSDGGFGYDSTDVAAIRYRIQKLEADRLLYVTDTGQANHFHMVFEAARQAGWIKPPVKVDHVNFGLVLVKGGGKIKSRDGETIPLRALLEAAQENMKEILVERMQKEKSTTGKFDEKHIEDLSWAIGVAAVKYSDLRSNRVNNYEFDEKAMCSPEGDTAVYLMYAYARVCSIIDKASEAQVTQIEGYNVQGASDKERSVALAISRFNEVLEGCLTTLYLHPLCGYLYALASELSTFLTNDNERVWAKRAADSKDPLQIEPSRGLMRLLLVRAVRAVLYEGLGLLGIVPFDRM